MNFEHDVAREAGTAEWCAGLRRERHRLINTRPTTINVQLQGTRLKVYVELETKLPSIEVGPIALAWLVNLTLTYDPDLQFPASYGHL